MLGHDPGRWQPWTRTCNINTSSLTEVPAMAKAGAGFIHDCPENHRGDFQQHGERIRPAQPWAIIPAHRNGHLGRASDEESSLLTGATEVPSNAQNHEQNNLKSTEKCRRYNKVYENGQSGFRVDRSVYGAGEARSVNQGRWIIGVVKADVECNQYQVAQTPPT